MSADFWWGLAALPIAAALIALLVFAVWVLFYMIWDDEYVHGPKRRLGAGRIAGRAQVLLAVADMRYVHRIFYFYGWTLLIGRQPRPAPRGRRLAETNRKIPFITALEEYYAEARDE